MKKWIRWFLLTGILAAGVFYLHGFVLGAVLDLPLERKLTDLFGLQVRIDGLQVYLLAGRVKASHVRFDNPREFAAEPHLDARAVEFDMDFWALRRKKVLIGTLLLNRPFYLIDRIGTPSGPRTNVVTWFRRIKGKRKIRPEGEAPSKKWEVLIQRIQIREGSFIFQDRSKSEDGIRLVFKQLDGYLDNLHWPSRGPSILSQPVVLKGVLGEKYPAPFWIEGNANFATSEVSFDLGGGIPEGDVREHPYFWKGLPVVLEGGDFQLKSRAVCHRKDLTSHNFLALKSLRVSPASSVSGVIWGFPMKAWIGFLQQEKEIPLRVNVEGNLSQPKFRFDQAFRAAFQEALKHHTSTGIKAIAEGSAKLAKQTQELAQKTPAGLVQGFEQLSTMVKKGAVNGLESLPKISGHPNTSGADDSEPAP